MSDRQAEHDVSVTGNDTLGWIHHCRRCGYRGHEAPPLPCPGEMTIPPGQDSPC